MLLPVVLALSLGATPVEGDCLLAVLGKETGSSEAQALARGFGLTDPGSLLPWKHGAAVGREPDGRVMALTLYGAQPDDGYGVQSPVPVRFGRRLPLGLEWEFTEAKVIERLGPPTAHVPDELAYTRQGLELRLQFVGGKLDRVRAMVRADAAPAPPVCASPPAPIEASPEERASLVLAAHSIEEGNCLLSLLGSTSPHLPRGVSAQSDAKGRVVSVVIELGKTSGEAFVGELPLGLPREAAALTAQLEPALFPGTRSLRYVTTLGVEVAFDQLRSTLALTQLASSSSLSPPYRCSVTGH